MPRCTGAPRLHSEPSGHDPRTDHHCDLRRRAAARRPISIGNRGCGRQSTRARSSRFPHQLQRRPLSCGLGPIEAVWDSLESRIISLGYAIEQVRARRIGELLTYVYVKALCDQCVRRLRSGEWQIALRRQRLIVESTEALRGLMPITSADDVWAMRFAAARSWLEIASRALGDMADPRLLRHAAEIGERLVTEAHQRKDVIGEARLLHRLGALFLDPYTAGRELAIRHNYELALKLWQERLRDGLGRVYDQLPEGDRWMPPVPTSTSAIRGLSETGAPARSGCCESCNNRCTVAGSVSSADPRPEIRS